MHAKQIIISLNISSELTLTKSITDILKDVLIYQYLIIHGSSSKQRD